MKKSLFFLIALLFGLFAFGQGVQLKQGVKVSKIPEINKKMTQADLSVYKVAPVVRSKPVSSNRGVNTVNIIPIGSAANAYTYGYDNGNATYVWADDNLKTVANTHRMGGEVGPPNQYSGDLSYDLSTDAGMNWTNQVKIYESNIAGSQYNLDAARYPQGLTYNPPGNTDPNNAWHLFFAATLDGSNGGTWGGYGYGVASYGDVEDTTKHLLASDLGAGFYQGIPTALTITHQGNAFVADASLLDSYTEYLDNIIFMSGEFNDETNDFEYDEFLTTAEAEYARYLKIAFSPDGMTGYVLWNDENLSIPMSEGWDYPLLLKTEDGGETWSDELIAVEISGEDGIDAVKNYLTDEQLEELFGTPIPDRDDILYTSPWFNTDISVDAFGNPHLAVSVFVAGNEPGYIVIEDQTFAVFDLYSQDEDNEDWYGIRLANLHKYVANYQPDNYREFNRTEVSSTMDGTKMFFTWLDTDLEGVEENTNPDIYARGFDLITNKITENTETTYGEDNVTAFSAAMWTAYFQCTSRFVLTNEEGDTYTIPMVYEDLNPENIIEPVQFMYIQDFSYHNDDFTKDSGNPPFPGVGIDETGARMDLISASDIFPNPASSVASLRINLQNENKLRLVLTDISGQQVLNREYGQVKAGETLINLDVSKLSSGIYSVNLVVDGGTLSRKLIVE